MTYVYHLKLEEKNILLSEKAWLNDTITQHKSWFSKPCERKAVINLS